MTRQAREQVFPAWHTLPLEESLEKCRLWTEDASFALVKKYKMAEPDKKIVGYFPVYSPLEIAHAAGMLPVAILGGGSATDIRQADALVPSFVCSIPRSALELALTGKLDFLDAMLFHPICDVARNMAQIWRRQFPGTKLTLLYLPQNLTSSGSISYLRSEYERLKRLLEEVCGREVTESDLSHSISTYNRQRRLLREIYRIRKEEPWLLSATEAYSIVRVGTMIPVEEHISLLERILKLLPGRNARPVDKIKVIFEGAFCEQPPLEFIEVVEQVCSIVDDDFMVGTRWFDDDVPYNGDALESLALGYRDLLSYAAVQHDGRLQKADAFMKKVRAAGAEAVILTAPKFCEPGLDDQVPFAGALEQEGIPHLTLEFEEKMTSFESVSIQVETFAESLLFGE